MPTASCHMQLGVIVVDAIDDNIDDDIGDDIDVVVIVDQ
jgi:hypothetical protein